ncbi:hypothetical protein IMG5_086590 [Ichthyophthirius multifiliis]|uniref:Transmembrane protein n=1 Tax=Ichthyophthirius multifiliis TaxID=5932 RepID=G0QR03_ICHMU|nr:hypothetical protein IMG5_086590 [Ichthyophthirius multifiliis]EGR32352.1 hypothetical protein IMG5_086590 [Ichthyophthirius multifiliis]|eukprot:XP_004035838.1 hypothetical protein IMG5_086590 [Ichthyophthirius multifiliis]
MKQYVLKNVQNVIKMEYALNANKEIIYINKIYNALIAYTYLVIAKIVQKMFVLNVFLDFTKIVFQDIVLQCLKEIKQMKQYALKIVKNVINLEYAINANKAIIYINKINNVFFVIIYLIIVKIVQKMFASNVFLDFTQIVSHDHANK